MNGHLLMRCLLVVYFVIACVFLYERNWAKASYWIGALIITASVLSMK